jgi:hypothetical protein
MAGQIILSVAYGIDVRPEGDPYVEEAEKVLYALKIGSTPEAMLFDTIPWCNYCLIPSFPHSKRGMFTDASGSNPYAKLVPRSELETSCP